MLALPPTLANTLRIQDLIIGYSAQRSTDLVCPDVDKSRVEGAVVLAKNGLCPVHEMQQWVGLIDPESTRDTDGGDNRNDLDAGCIVDWS